MIVVFLALACAIGYGGSDFAAGLASRQASVIRVTILAGAVSVLLMLLVVPWVSRGSLSWGSVGWAVVSGLGGMAGAVILFLGFRHAKFSVAGPLSAVVSAILSVLAGLAFGEHPSGLALAGIALALPAIVAVSASPGPSGLADVAGNAIDVSRVAHDLRAGSDRHLFGVVCGLLAGTGFGVMFVGLNRAGSGGDLWPAVISQAAGLALVCLLGAVRGQLRLPPRRASWLAVVNGVTGAGGTLCFFVATHAGLLAVTAVITSLYPGSTILLARLVLGERITRIRVAGLALAATSVAIIAVASAG